MKLRENPSIPPFLDQPPPFSFLPPFYRNFQPPFQSILSNSNPPLGRGVRAMPSFLLLFFSFIFFSIIFFFFHYSVATVGLTNNSFLSGFSGQPQPLDIETTAT